MSATAEQWYAEAAAGPDYVKVDWPGGPSSRFHAQWLRDNCGHPSRYTEVTGERTQLTEDIPADLKAEEVWIEHGQTLVVAWSDKTANSRFDLGWLWENRYEERPPVSLDIPPRVWGARYGSAPETFRYDQVCEDRSTLIAMLDAYFATGLIRVTGVPARDREVERFANRLAYVREIAFDRVADIKARADAYTLGFTDAALPLHTDCSGYAWPPNTMLFHCLSNDVQGGEALYADGALAVRELRRRDPEALRIMSEMPIEHRLYSKTADTRHVAPRITLTPAGELAIMRYANWTPQPLRPGKFEDVAAFYDAQRELASILNDPANVAKIRPEPGDLLIINNHRVLHGRNAYSMDSGERHFQQVYMELDDLRSLRRVLTRDEGSA